MKRKSRILFMPILLTCIAMSVYSCYLRYQTAQNGGIEYDERTSFPSSDQHTLDCLSVPKSALPLQIERLRVPTINITAREQVKQTSQSAFGKPASEQIAHRVISVIRQTSSICLALPPSKISYPFSYFW